MKYGLAKTPADPASLGGGRRLWIFGPKPYRIPKSGVCSFVPDSILLTEGSILRDIGITLLIIMGEGVLLTIVVSFTGQKMC